jgi:hypothetical protein
MIWWDLSLQPWVAATFTMNQMSGGAFMTSVLISTPCGILARRFPVVIWLFAILDYWHCITDDRQARYCYHTILHLLTGVSS